MLSAEDILNLVKRGEGYNLDFKRSVPSKVRELTEEVCSFLNAAGGYLLIGVNDNNEIVGAEINNSKRSAIQGSIGEISPMCHYNMYDVDVNGKQVWVIEVPSGKNKPYFYGGCTYLREGANSQKLTNVDEIRQVFQRNERIYFDTIPFPKVDIAEQLDDANFLEFKHESHIVSEVAPLQVLDSLQIFDENNVVKCGGVLFFAKHPENYFFHAVIRCVMFKGTEKVYLLDDKTFGGPLLQQYKKAMEWLKDKLQVSYIIEGAGPRKEVWEIPLGVFKEAIINALAHRDYDEQGASITIELFDDRVEISNPGTLLPVVAKNFGKKSLSRNPLIFGLFTRMHLVEHIGSGIPRMRKEMLDAGLPEPVFETEGMFTIVLSRTSKVNAQPLSEMQAKLIEIVKRNPTMSMKEMGEMMGVGRTSIYKIIRSLKEMGILEYAGRKNHGQWVVKI
ncbi:MAG: ATP-binding protein [Sodaliphilus sp.]